MGLYPLRTLRHALMEIEVELQRRWSLKDGAAPPGLRPYRARWLQFLQSSPLQELPSLWQGITNPELVLVGDFHSLPRSARTFADLVRQHPSQIRPRIVLELLPAKGHVELSQLSGQKLVDGRLLGAAMPELVALCQQKGLEVWGSWFEGTPAERDRLSARAWARRNASAPCSPELWFFGDWHLAENHLPAELRSLGGEPLCVHQSPAPLWQRGARLRRETFLQLSEGHRAWMHTPPLAYLTSSAWQASADPAEDLEASESLVEALAAGLWRAFEREDSQPEFEALSESEWSSFWRSLPTDWREEYLRGSAPQIPVLHPTQERAFLPAHASWNDLCGVAAGLIAQRERPQMAPDAVSHAFRTLCQLSWNPFYPRHRHQVTRTKPASALSSALELGESAASVLSRSGQTTVSEAQQLLRLGTRSFIWHQVMSTIRAESATA